jgi:glycosyltransferase involved in cell wall biosynthesis
MRILFVTTGLAYGGAETQLKELAIRLKRRGGEVQIASMLPPAAYGEELQEHGIPIYNLRMRRKIPDPRALFRLAAIVRQWRPDVVHAHMVHANLLARLTRLLAPVPVLICTAHSLDEGGWLRERAYQLTDWLCDLTTQVSRAGLERYIRVKAAPAHKIIYIPNGIDLSRFTPDPERRHQRRCEWGLQGAFIWLAVGRLESPKAYPLLLAAFQKVHRAFPRARLLIMGDGSLRPTVKCQIVERGLEGAVELLGIRRDVPDWMQVADAYVMSSLWEGMPMVLLEAAATALPIVATDVGGNAEIVVDRVNGYLVPPANPDALAEAMQQVMNLPEDARQAMGAAGRAHVVQNFDMERIVDQWEALYQEQLERKGLI